MFLERLKHNCRNLRLVAVSAEIRTFQIQTENGAAKLGKKTSKLTKSEDGTSHLPELESINFLRNVRNRVTTDTESYPR